MPNTSDVFKSLLGSTAKRVKPLSPDTWYVQTDTHFEGVVKRVPRQEQGRWKSGRPWAELVAIDLLAAEGGPVPPLVAADLKRGLLVQTFVSGQTLRNEHQHFAKVAFPSLVSALIRIETIFEKEFSVIRPFVVAYDDEAEKKRLFGDVAPFLETKSLTAWKELLEQAFGSETMLPGLGSLDVQPGNVLVDDDGAVTVIDFATIGRQHREQRLVGYTYRKRPIPDALLDEACYAYYADRYGRAAAFRLAFYDFAYTFRMIRENLRSKALKKDGFATIVGDSGLTMWGRPRLDDPLIHDVRQGLIPEALKELQA